METHVLSDDLRTMYGDIYPSEYTLEWCKRHIYHIWPELKQFESTTHFIYAGANSDYPFLKRTKESVAEEILTEYNNGKRNFLFECLPEGVYIPNLELIHDTIPLIRDIFPNITLIYFSGAADTLECYEDMIKQGKFVDRIHVASAAFFEYAFKNEYTTYDIEYKPENKLKKFLCFNKVSRQHRIDLLENMLDNDLVKDAYYSFDIDDEHLNILEHNNNYPNIMNIKDQLPLVLNRSKSRDNPVGIEPDDLDYFNNSYFSIVTETIFYDLRRIETTTGKLYVHVPSITGTFLSEKIYKCLAMKHPFIVLGCPNFLKQLQNRGYKTFSPYIDESYDNVVDDYERFDLIIKEITRLCSYTDEQWLEFTKNIQSIVEHNYDLYHSVSDFRITKNILDMLK